VVVDADLDAGTVAVVAVLGVLLVIGWQL